MFEYRSVLDRPTYDPFGWDVFRGLDQLVRELDRQANGAASDRNTATVTEESDRFVLNVDVPGLAEKDVKVDYHDGVLTISAERAVETPEGHQPRRRERAAFRISRSYSVGDSVDPEKTTAQIQDGVLTVSIAKAAAAQKKSITVKTA